MYSVSVIMPVYNNEQTLKRAIDSILGQTIYDLELILVNDGSTDASAQICEEYVKKEPLLVEVIHQEHSGLAQARNKGLLNSSGKYIYFADAMDTYQNKMLADNFRLAEEKEAELVVFGFTEQNDEYLEGKLEHLPRLPELSTQEIFRQHFRNFYHFFPYILHNKLYRRDYLKNNRIRFHNIPMKEAAFFNLDVYKNLDKIAFNRASYCNRYNHEETLRKDTYDENLYKINLKLANYFEKMMSHWGHETMFRDLIVNQYYRAVYDELQNISAKDSGLSVEEQQEKINTILADEKVTVFLKKLKTSREKNPYMKAVLVALQNSNGKAAIHLITHKNGTEETKSKISRFFNKLFRR